MWRRPYHTQYESSDDPWPRTVIGWIFWLIFMMPGTIILWLRYYYPEHGQVIVGGRQAQNKIVTFLTTMGFYGFWIGLVLFAFVLNAASRR